jgi:hypothetical protein
MSPIVTTEYNLTFGLPISPWWLLLALPAVCALGLLLYRGQGKRVDHRHFAALRILRLLLLAGLVFLAFRPSLIHRLVRRYPGRVLLVLDDSASMETRDTGYTGPEALRLSRWIRPAEQSAQPAAVRIASHLRSVEWTARSYQRVALGGGEGGGEAAAERAVEAQDDLFDLFDGIDEAAADLPTLPEEAQAPATKARQGIDTLKNSIPKLFQTAPRPGREVFDRYAEGCAQTASYWLDVQSTLDRKALADGNEALAAAVEKIRNATRQELLVEAIRAARPAFERQAPGQVVRVVRMSDGEQLSVDELGLEWIRGGPAGGPSSPILQRLKALAEEEHSHPLSSVALLSDGRHFAEMLPGEAVQGLVRQAVPLDTVAAGDLEEPTDLSILELVAPPFAVVNDAIRVRARLKTSLPAARSIQVSVVEAGPEGAERVAKSVELGGAAEQTVQLGFAPDQVGRKRYTLRVATTKGEVFPNRNNATDFVTDVRPEKVSVLLLDWKPRWETQFAINTFRRLEYIDLNAIVVLAQPDTTLRRGAARGTWPESEDALAMYDLIVLGDVPEGVLSQAEWEQLSRAVTEGGKTLALLAPERVGGPVENLLDLPPALPGDVASRLAEATSPEPLRLLAGGGAHPLSAGLRHGVARGVAQAEGLAPGSVPLLAAEDQPALDVQFLSERGKTVSMRTPSLWRMLNPTLLKAHRDMYVNLVTWAVRGGWNLPLERAADARLALDRAVLHADESLQVWLPAGEADSLEAVQGEQVTATTQAEPLRQGALGRASFPQLPVGEVLVRREGQTEGVQVQVLSDDPELLRLSRKADVLEELASVTGGQALDAGELERLLMDLEPRERIEKEETIYVLWDHWLVLGLLAALLTAEWIWRKLVGLI